MMVSRNFWSGMVFGAAAGMALVALMREKRPQTPMERTKVVMGRTARRAHGALRAVAGRFAD